MPASRAAMHPGRRRESSPGEWRGPAGRRAAAGPGPGFNGRVFIIFGLKTSDRRVGSQVMICEICGVTAAQVLIRRSTRLSLFFIPLIPVKPARHYLQCSNCGTVRHSDRHALAAR